MATGNFMLHIFSTIEIGNKAKNRLYTTVAWSTMPLELHMKAKNLSH